MQNKKLIAFNIKETVNHNHWIEFVSFSNNEQLLAFCSADIVTIVELEQNASCQLLHDTVVWRCAFVDSDTYIVTTGSNGFLYKWNLVQRTQSLSKKLHKDTIFGLSVHPHEPIVITGGRDGAIVCYNHDTDTIITALRGHTDSVEDVAFSLCGRFIASGSKDKVVLLWNSYLDKDQVSAVSFTGHRHYVTQCAFSNDSKLLATVSYDKRIGIWSIEERCLISFLRGHTNIIWGCVFISNDMLITCSSDKSVRLWSPESQRKSVEVHSCLGGVKDGKAQILSCAFAPKSRRLAASTFGGKLFLADINDDSETDTADSIN